MSLTRYGREVVLPLLVAGLAALGCGGQDSARETASPDKHRGTSEAAGTPQPADEESLAEEAAPAEKKSPVAGPRRGKIMRRLDERRIRVGPRTVVIDRETLACGRAGTKRGADERARVRLRCVQPTFRSGVPGPDAIFFVHPTRTDSLVITSAHLTSY